MPNPDKGLPPVSEPGGISVSEPCAAARFRSHSTRSARLAAATRGTTCAVRCIAPLATNRLRLRVTHRGRWQGGWSGGQQYAPATGRRGRGCDCKPPLPQDAAPPTPKTQRPEKGGDRGVTRAGGAPAEKALQRKADAGVSSDWEAAAASVNLGGPIAQHRPKSKIVKDVEALVDRLTAQAPRRDTAMKVA